MDTPTSVLGERAGAMGETMDIQVAVEENIEKRPRRAALDVAWAVDSEVAQANAQWRNPELKPQVEAHQSLVVEGEAGAVSAWVAEGRNRVLGQELSLEGEQQKKK